MKSSTQSPFKLVTWNVNSINMRLERLIKLLGRENPDVVCLQELKCTEDKFPFEPIQDMGYHVHLWGQKTYNGVAILSKTEPDKYSQGWGKDDSASEARIITAYFKNLTVLSVYVPNGQSVGSDKYRYKLDWLKQLHATISQHLKRKESLIVCGDFNIALNNLDVHDPTLWKDQILFSEPEKSALQELLSLGLSDFFRVIHPKIPGFTWWDYRSGAFPRDHGLRIDLILGNSSLAQQLEDVYVDRNERKGEKPSDHAPVICVFKAETFLNL